MTSEGSGRSEKRGSPAAWKRLPRAWFAALLAVVGGGLLALLLWPKTAPPTPTTPATAPQRTIAKIDVHVHLALPLAGELLGIMDESGIQIALNASGGTPGSGLERSAQIAQQTRGRVLPYCNLAFNRAEDPDWDAYVRETLGSCKRLGAVGLKIFKSLGLGVTLSDGALLPVDDDRLDLVFEEAGRLGLPVLIHSGDPQAFFRPPTEDNERFAELSAHPGWSFYGERRTGPGDWPGWEEIFAQFERRVARHPDVTFVGAHFGNAPEEPRRVALMLEQHPNYVVETAARVPEIGRHPAGEMRRMFERFQDRILFGTDLSVTSSGLILGSSGDAPDDRTRVPAFFAAHWQYFETNGRHMAHPTPIQGSWTIDGIGLDRPVLEKLYWRNAARVFGLSLPDRSEAP